MIALVFLRNLVLTAGVEGLLIVLLFRKKELVYYSLLCNMLTNPAMNLLLMAAVGWWGAEAYGISLAVLELAVVGIEAGVYRLLCRWRFQKAIAVSLALNAASFLLGLVWF